jgi:hypothetical protein
MHDIRYTYQKKIGSGTIEKLSQTAAAIDVLETPCIASRGWSRRLLRAEYSNPAGSTPIVIPDSVDESSVEG